MQVCACARACVCVCACACACLCLCVRSTCTCVCARAHVLRNMPTCATRAAAAAGLDSPGRDSLRAGKRLLKEKSGAAAMVRFEKALMLSKALEDKVRWGAAVILIMC